ncbi:YceI family protein [Ohtaekwangia sp.]|uniref:YceI family protein n=1 Tax=Ohtaekwangia sp. TaxID=2066019 RepID=UPI002FDD8434
MRVISFIVLLVACSVAGTYAQKYTASKSSITFFSHATIEDIKADNQKATSVFYSNTGDIAFIVPVNEFQFKKSLMQEHFNEKYMETEKYPKSTFQGKVSGYDPANAASQNVTAKGKLTIHGVTRDVEIPGTIEKSGDNLIMKSVFIVKLVDYKVDIPKLMWQNIAEQVEVTLNFTYKPQ